MSRQAGQMAGQLASELRRADQWKYSQFGIRSLEKFDQFNQFGIRLRKERRVYTQFRPILYSVKKREKSIQKGVQHFQLASRRSLSMIAWSTLFDAENVFRLLPVGVPRSMEENVPQKNHFRLLSDNKQRGL